MIEPSKIFGRLGNSLFQYATLYAKSRDEGTDFFFQDPKYFDKYKSEIKSLFGADIQPIDMIAIHVRRGDYVNNTFYVDLSTTDYYEKAMGQFLGASFLVFSDDIGFCKNHFKGKKYTFCQETDEIKALNLMAGCRGHIIANSSFSWWAAYLSPYSKKIIAPKEWYADGKERTKLPNHWIRI